MVRLYPPAPKFPHDNGAEHSVWRALRDNVPDDVLIFAHVPLQIDDDEGEIDLIVAWPDVGIAVIEVKGGHISRRDGQWVQSGAAGARTIDPVGQIQRARHLLADGLHNAGFDVRDLRMVHLVAFAHVAVPDTWGTLDLPRAMLIDRTEIENGVAAVARVKKAMEQYGHGHSGLPHDDVENLVDHLARGFPSQVEHLVAAAMHAAHADQLTSEQHTTLDLLENQRRTCIVGGAGSGKTWLALEKARRLARNGERVALLCYSRGLGRYLQRTVDTWPRREHPAFVGLFHDLPIEWGANTGADDNPDYWERELPIALGALADGMSESEKFDSVVVDEAQDFGDLWWPSLMRCLRDAESGGVFVFMDEAQRVFPRDGEAPIDLPPFALCENLRSTKQIAQTFSSMSDRPVRPRGLDGPRVRVIDVPEEQAIETADECIDLLIEDGWEPGQIALLATGRRHPAQVGEVEAGGYQSYWDQFFAAEDVFYGHVLGFKGLERAVVVLTVNGIRDMDRARQILYTGMSRARSLLVIVGPRGLVESVGGEGVRRRLAGS